MLLEVGRIHKPHGLSGEVSVSFISNRPERWQTGAKLKVLDKWLTIESARVHQDRMLVQFQGYHSRTEAEILTGQTLFGESIQDENALWVHEVIGATVIDSDRVAHGAVVEVISNPASDLMLLESGILVPMAFVQNFDQAQKIIIVDAPEGLFDLQ